MASHTNTIGILIAAKDEASAAIAKAAERTKAASTEVNGLGKESESAGGLLSGKFLGGILAVGAAVTVFKDATQKAADYQQQLTKLVTSAGESQANLGLVGDGIKSLAIQTGASVSDLANGMYIVESAGQHGADGLKVLKAAEQGAKAEGSDLATVADALTSALKDYHYGADDAATVTSKLVAATGAGKTTFQDLAAAMPAILPTASAAHVSLNDILGDLASMTVHGMSADQAAQNLAHTIRSLENPTATQAKEFALLGLTTTQMSADLQNKGVSGTLQEISDKIKALVAPGSDKVILDLSAALKSLPAPVQDLGQKLLDGSISAKAYAKEASALDPISAKQAVSFSTLAGSMHRIGDQQMTGAQVMQNYTQALAKATGTSDGLNVALMLTGENAQTTNDAIKAVSDATAEAGNNVKGWADIQNNFNTKWAQFQQLLDVGMLSLGQALLPILTKVLDQIMKMADTAGKILAPAFQMLGEVWTKYLEPPFEALAHDLGDKVGKFFGIVLAGAIVLLVAPLIILGALLSATAATLDWIVKTSENVADAIKKFLSDPIKGLHDTWSGLKSDAHGIWGDIKNSLHSAFDAMLKDFESFPGAAARWAKETAKGFVAEVVRIPRQIVHLADDVGDVFKKVVDKAISEFEKIGPRILAFIESIPGKIGSGLVKIGDSIAASIEKGFHKLIAKAPGLALKVVDGIKAGFKALLNYDISSVMNWIDQGRRFYDNAVQLVVQFANGIKQTFDAFKDKISQWASEILPNLGETLANLPKELVTFFANLPKVIGQALSESGRQMAQQHVDGMKSNFTDMNKMKELGNAILKGIGEAVLAILGGIALVALSIVIALINGLIAAWKGEIKFFADVISGTWNAVVGAFTSWSANMISWAKSAVKGIVNEFLALPGQITSAIGNGVSGAASSVKNALHNAHIPGFASGGFTGSGSSNEVAGIVHKGEYVLPKSAVDQSTGLPKMMGGGSSLTINGGLHIHNNMDEQRFLKDLGWRLSLS